MISKLNPRLSLPNHRALREFMDVEAQFENAAFQDDAQEAAAGILK
jgi:hypothetical protein